MKVCGLLALVPLLMLGGCATAPHGGGGTASSTLCVQKISLSKKEPVNRELGIRLISVNRNGLTTIEVLGSHRRLHATPGQGFVSKAFGRCGLELSAVSYRDQTVSLNRYTCSTEAR